MDYIVMKNEIVYNKNGKPPQKLVVVKIRNYYMIDFCDVESSPETIITSCTSSAGYYLSEISALEAFDRYRDSYQNETSIHE